MSMRKLWICARSPARRAANNLTCHSGSKFGPRLSKCNVRNTIYRLALDRYIVRHYEGLDGLLRSSYKISTRSPQPGSGNSVNVHQPTADVRSALI
ncbi:hypothetical protein AG1IA_09903 [Rhizoctonia solani AG-1 IA]|uniref:Uncharacterized protein n=1 Tax=Thanatephorus cucumeris (strain AG1-IA) TaxID=983506 RepID=L8WH59_THACA|nr:hypothetical protein AG1IA_09903 [Rhizoctonia solani AG-1 IA]